MRGAIYVRWHVVFVMLTMREIFWRLNTDAHSVIIFAETLGSSVSFLSKKGAFMLRNSETIRELDTAELDQVGGGLSLGVGVNLDLSSELGAVSGVLDTVLGAVGGLVGGVTGGLTGG